MKSFKVNDGKVTIDGVIYSQSPKDDVNIFGKSGRIHSVMIEGRGQFFPIGGSFNDGTTPIVDTPIDTPTETKKKGKLAKTELVEKSSQAVGVDGKPITKRKTSKKK